MFISRLLRLRSIVVRILRLFLQAICRRIHQLQLQLFTPYDATDSRFTTLHLMFTIYENSENSSHFIFFYCFCFRTMLTMCHLKQKCGENVFRKMLVNKKKWHGIFSSISQLKFLKALNHKNATNIEKHSINWVTRLLLKKSGRWQNEIEFS